jgi:hypothetical protein
MVAHVPKSPFIQILNSVGFIQVASSSSKQYKGAKDGLTPIFSNHCHAPGQQKKWP